MWNGEKNLNCTFDLSDTFIRWVQWLFTKMLVTRVLILLTSISLISESVLSFSNYRKTNSFSRKIKPTGIGRKSKHKKYLGRFNCIKLLMYFPFILAYDQINQFYKKLGKKHSYSEIGVTVIKNNICIFIVWRAFRKNWRQFWGSRNKCFKNQRK